MNMTRIPFHLGIVGLVALIAVAPSWAQKTGSTGSSGPSQQPGQSGGSGPANQGQPGSVINQPSMTQMPTPTFVNGRVVMDTGQPVPEPVLVGLNCGMRSVQVIHTDSKGYFQFVLGVGIQGNMDFSASDDTFSPYAGVGGGVPGSFNAPIGMGPSAMGPMGSGLFGCELHVSIPGYEPLVKTITDPNDIGGIDVGTLHLRRLAGVQGAAISVTSLLVPNNARKEFEKADKDLRGNHVDSATQHLQKAVSEYDKYAAAWNALGAIYSGTHQLEKANQAYSKAIASDPNYIPPYVGLAAMQFQAEDYDSAAETAGKVLNLDPRIGIASFLQGAAYFRLNRIDDAEKSALVAEQEPHQNIPQLHVLLAQILVEKQDYPKAAAEMRAYLKEAPKGNFADDMKKSLQEIESSESNADGNSDASAKHPQIAP